MTTFQIGKSLFLVLNSISVLFNASVAIWIYNIGNENVIFNWEWCAFAALISTVSFIWVLSWREL